jgi:putative tryptophan/tyrosine transport system ATP-binding protein
MHRGNVVLHAKTEEKHSLTVNDLLARFEDLRRRDQMDGPAAEMLRRQYV